MGYLEPKPDKLVTQDYDLIHSVQRLDVRPKQLLLTAISHVNPQVPLSQQPKPFVVDITAQQWIETWGERLNPYRDLKESAEMLNGKRFWIQNDRHKKSWRNWITGAEYHEREGRITVQLHPDLMPYLCGAMAVFSTMKILHIKGFGRLPASDCMSLPTSSGYPVFVRSLWKSCAAYSRPRTPIHVLLIFAVR